MHRYNYKSDFVQDVTMLLKYFSSILVEKNVDNRIVWFETFHQHFHPKFDKNGNSNNMNGYFEPNSDIGPNETYRQSFYNDVNSVHSPGCCSPINNRSFAADWRNRIVRDILAASEPDKFPKLRYVPMSELTMPLDTMHNCNLFNIDCTHLCFMPLLWSPIWRAIYDTTITIKLL